MCVSENIDGKQWHDEAKGKVFKYGSNVDTDVIIPARYLNVSDARLLAAHCMEDIDGHFAGAVAPGDYIVAAHNFGCGSSREHAPRAILASGIRCVIACSFARIFYRNAINIGLPIIECPEAASAIAYGDVIGVDFETGEIYNYTQNTTYKGQGFPPFIQNMIAHGGLVEATKRTLAELAKGGTGHA